MDPSARSEFPVEPFGPKTMVTKTNLYRLIEAIQEEASPGEDAMVVEVVSRLLRAGRIRIPFSCERGEDFSNAEIFGT
jgi:hypothetical protein